MKRIFSLALAVLVTTSLVHAQGDKSTRPSPPDSATGKIGGATITVNYGSPSLKGRKIGTELAPYGKTWRAGANEATTFETSKNIKVGGKDLPAGKYTLFALPNEKEWQFMFNSQLGQWGIKRSGEANIDSTKTVLTVSAKPGKSSSEHERLVYEVNSKGVMMKWGNMEVPIPIK